MSRNSRVLAGRSASQTRSRQDRSGRFPRWRDAFPRWLPLTTGQAATVVSTVVDFCARLFGQPRGRRPAKGLESSFRRGMFFEPLEDRRLLALGDLAFTLLEDVTSLKGDQAGYAVATEGDYVVVGARLDDTLATNTGSVYVFDLLSMTPETPVFTIRNPDPQPTYRFGEAVAISGDYVVVGMDQGATPGFAYVYDLASADPTTPIDTLDNPFPDRSDFFGLNVGVSGDYLAVSAHGDDFGAGSAGRAYVYDLASGSPIPLVTLNNPAPQFHDRFGSSIAVSGDYVVVGADLDDTVGTNAGSVYVYDMGRPSATRGNPAFTFHNPNFAASDLFGWDVSASGSHVVVGTRSSTNAGNAYVYDLTSATPTTPIAELDNPNPAADDLFGSAVSVSGDLVLVGAHQDDTGFTNSGIAYVYDLTSATLTTPVATLNNPTPKANDQFGWSVAVDKYIVVGSPTDVGAVFANGAAHVFGIAPGSLFATANGSGNIKVRDANATGFDNDFAIALDGADLVISDTNEQFSSAPSGWVLASDGLSIRTNAAAFTGSITVDGAGGDDTLTVDYTGGMFDNEILFDGGGNNAGGDELIFLGGTAADVEYGYANANDGSVDVDGRLITYTGLEPITSTISGANVTLRYLGSSETITVADAGGGRTTVNSTLGELTTFNNPSESLLIATGIGGDFINVNSLAANYPANITIDGEGGSDTLHLNASLTLNGSFSSAVETVDGADITTNGGSVSFTSISQVYAHDIVTNGGDISFDVNGSLDVQQSLNAGTGSLAITANNFSSTGTITADRVAIKTFDPSYPTHLGGADSMFTLGLSDAELDTIDAATIIVGAANAGDVTVTGTIDRNASTDVEIVSGGKITLDPGFVDTAGGTLKLSPGTSVVPTGSGTDAAAGTVSFSAGADLDIRVNGTGVDTHYTQLNVVGQSAVVEQGPHTRRLCSDGKHTWDAHGYELPGRLAAVPVRA